jgi:hypothetical protein
MLGCVDAGFEAIQAMALNAAISGSILADLLARPDGIGHRLGPILYPRLEVCL